MRLWVLAGLLLIGLTAAGNATGSESGYGWGWSCFAPAKPCGCCPNDYCSKPMPVVCPVRCCGPNDYCCKPLPAALCPAACCGPNDYCRKPLPMVEPACYPWYTCGACKAFAPPSESVSTPSPQ